MEIEVKWHESRKLLDGSNKNLIYDIPDLDEYYEMSGVYMFCRRYGKSIAPIYIGKSKNIGNRISQHFNSTKKMKGIENSLNGERILIVGEIICKKGQKIDKCMKIVEKALIDHALANEFELVNDKGTKSEYHKLHFNGNLAAKNFTKKSIYVKMEPD